LGVDVFGRIEYNQVVRLAFDLPDTHSRIEAIAQISWANQLARRAGLKFVDPSERLVQQIGEWISVQNIAAADMAPASEAEVLWASEQLAELRASLTQTRTLREPKLSERIIYWLRMPVSQQVIGFSLGTVLMLGTLLVLAYVMVEQHLQVRTAQAINVEPIRLSERPEVTLTTEPPASNSPLLNPAVIPEGAILLQVAALTREQDALALAETLGEKKYPALVRMSGADDYYRVQVGPYLDAASARSARRKLEKEGFKPIVKH
jgi:cell division septation protein DedD